jgi:uncharacterized protein YutE (UPF0331/DUF86 family)
MSGANEWLALIAENQSSKIDKIGKEWKTREQIQKELNYCVQYTIDVLNDLIKKKKVEKKNFKVMRSNKIQAIPHYRIIK